MALLILALFIGVPLVEIALFIQVGGLIGLWPTIGIVILTAVIGTALLRQQGLATLQRAQAELDAQRMPVRELFDGACLLVAGVLLLTPGFFTDAVGFALMVPPLRRIIGMAVWRALQRHGTVHVHASGFPGGGPGRGPGHGPGGGPGQGQGRGPVIDGEYEDLSEDGRGNARPTLPAGDQTDEANGNGAGNPDSPWRQERD